MKIITIVLLLSLALYGNAQTLNPTEQKIRSEIARHLPEYLAMLEKTVNINSGSLNVEGVKAVGQEMGRAFQQIGFNTEWILLPDSLKRAGHLVAQNNPGGKKKILLIGHLDTVFEPDMEANPFRYINDSTVTGQGIADMKSGNVIMFAACQVLQELGLLKNTTLVAYYTGDEEKTGEPQEVSRKHFIETAKSCTYALGFETAQGLGTVATGRRGFSEWFVEVNAKQGHSAGIFGNNAGYGAAYELSRVINGFRERLANQRNLTFNPGIMVAGSDVNYNESNVSASLSGKPNIISPKAYAAGDLRFLTLAQRDSARQVMLAIAAKSLNGTSTAVKFKNGFPSMEPKPANDSLVSILNRVSQRLGYGAVRAGDPGSRGAGDIAFVSFLPCIDGLGGNGTGAHAPGETLHIPSFSKLIERAALLIYQLSQ